MTEIMIVDDDPSIRRMLERTLAAEGYDVRLAADGGAALAELERSLPDLLVLDVAMPGLDGLAVAERARAREWSLPILFLTARDTVEDAVAGFEAGGDDYLVKPFAIAELLVRCGRCSGEHALPDVSSRTATSGSTHRRGARAGRAARSCSRRGRARCSSC
jgi:two-component system, OmpR family, response regulator MprA